MDSQRHSRRPNGSPVPLSGQDPPLSITAAEIARHLCMDVSTFHKRRKLGLIPLVPVSGPGFGQGKKQLYNRVDAIEWLATLGLSAQPRGRAS